MEGGTADGSGDGEAIGREIQQLGKAEGLDQGNKWNRFLEELGQLVARGNMYKRRKRCVYGDWCQEEGYEPTIRLPQDNETREDWLKTLKVNPATFVFKYGRVGALHFLPSDLEVKTHMGNVRQVRRAKLAEPEKYTDEEILRRQKQAVYREFRAELSGPALEEAWQKEILADHETGLARDAAKTKGSRGGEEKKDYSDAFIAVESLSRMSLIEVSSRTGMPRFECRRLSGKLFLGVLC